MPFVYMLRCGDGSLYTGIAKNLDKRLAQHQAGRASRYTRSRLPVALVWSRDTGSWGDALREEMRIKRLSRAEKEVLVRRKDEKDPKDSRDSKDEDKDKEIKDQAHPGSL